MTHPHEVLSTRILIAINDVVRDETRRALDTHLHVSWDEDSVRDHWYDATCYTCEPEWHKVRSAGTARHAILEPSIPWMNWTT